MKDFSSAFFKQGNFARNIRVLTTATGAKKSAVMLSNHASVQLAEVNKENSESIKKEALQNKLSTVSFEKCEIHLKHEGLIPQTESLSFSKVDWNPDINTDEFSNADMEKSSSVSFDIFTQNGTKIDIRLCQNITTEFNIFLKNEKQLNLTKYQEISDKGFNMYDSQSPYFNDRCIRIRKTDKSAVINDRRKNFDNVTAGCNKGCKMEKIDTNTKYITCNCGNYEPEQEVYPDFGKVFINTLNSINKIQFLLVSEDLFFFWESFF